jgi:hypothetical protein
LDKFPELEPYIVGIAALVAADDPQDPEGRMTLLSSLIVLVKARWQEPALEEIDLSFGVD